MQVHDNLYLMIIIIIFVFAWNKRLLLYEYSSLRYPDDTINYLYMYALLTKSREKDLVSNLHNKMLDIGWNPGDPDSFLI